MNETFETKRSESCSLVTLTTASYLYGRNKIGLSRPSSSVAADRTVMKAMFSSPAASKSRIEAASSLIIVTEMQVSATI